MDRLAELKAEAARLSARIAELEAGKAVPPPPPRDEGVRVVPLLAERTDAMPDLRQMQRLFDIVKPLSPWPSALVDKYDDTRPFRAFCSTFRWLMNVPRSDRPNGKVALSYHLDTCRTFLRARGAMVSDLDVNALVLSCYACGDISYCPGNPALGVVWEIGISEHAGRPADPAGWRRILNEGAAAVLPPSAPARRMAPLSPARVVY